jgi:hypothetical protein
MLLDSFYQTLLKAQMIDIKPNNQNIEYHNLFYLGKNIDAKIYRLFE